MRFYRSKSGKVQSELKWQEDLKDFFASCISSEFIEYIPHNSWDKFKSKFGLEEVEISQNSHSFNGVF